MATQPESWTVKLVEDPETGELILPFPPDLLAQVGWDFGDSIAWDFDGDAIVLTKQDDQN